MRKVKFYRLNGVIQAIHPVTGVQFEFHSEIAFYMWLFDKMGFCS
jgi:hypothetical protein